jgi:hypothetical protein
MPQLSICMPSNRNLAKSKASIESALAYAEAVGARFILSDNSRDPEKRAFFEGRSACLTYVVPDNDDPMVNMMTALSHVDTPFLLPMGDDDEVHLLDGETPVDLASLPADVAGVRPRTQIWTTGEGVTRTERFTIDAEAPDERLMEYNQKARGNNTIYYSIYRTSLFKPLLELFYAAHPTRGGYCDWALCLSLFACGKMIHDPSMVYRYDLGRWSHQKDIDDTKLFLYRMVGLPDTAENFWALLVFVDLHIFLMRGGLPLTLEDRQKALLMNCRISLATFVREVRASPKKYDETTLYLVELIEAETQLDAILQIVLVLTDCIQPGLKERYVRFYQAAVTA